MKRRFYRSNLETIVWDPEKGKALVEFVDGQVVTEDPRVIEKLKELGYPEVDLKATHPPPIPEVFQPAESPDVPIMPPGMTEEAALKRQRLLDAKMQSQRKAAVVPTPTKESAAKSETTKASPKPKMKKTAKKRPLKRRKKD